jgi:predicted MFS family arabinose efflux permease
MYMTAPIAYVVLRNNCGWRKATCVLGFIVMIISLIAASFANTVPQLIATQGVSYAVGGSLHYFPAYLYIDEWFVQRRGLAYGLFIAGAGASGVGVPLLMEWILHFWGFRIAFRVWALICVLITTPALFCLKPYPSNSHQDKGQRKLDWGFLKSPAFWILSFGNSVQSMGYFIPLLYLQCNYAGFHFEFEVFGTN